MKVNLKSPPDCVLKDYRISAFQLVTKSRTATPNALNVECLFCPEKGTEERYVVRLSITYTDRQKTRFSLRVVVNGYFQWRGGYRQKEGNAFLAWVNGGTILYGIVRSTIAELTASSECGRVLLPTVMMVDIVRAQINEAVGKKNEAKAEVSEQRNVAIGGASPK